MGVTHLVMLHMSRGNITNYNLSVDEGLYRDLTDVPYEI